MPTTFASRLASCMEIEYRPPARTSDDYNHGEMVSASGDIASIYHSIQRYYSESYDAGVTRLPSVFVFVRVCLCVPLRLSVAGRYFSSRYLLSVFQNIAISVRYIFGISLCVKAPRADLIKFCFRVSPLILTEDRTTCPHKNRLNLHQRVRVNLAHWMRRTQKNIKPSSTK